MKSQDADLASAAKLASLNIILQISLRIGSFVANAVLLRILSREVLGIVNVRLMLLYTTCQLLSREATRRACISEAKLYKWPVSVNCIWLNIPVSIIIGSVLSYVWLNFLFEPQPSLHQSYQSAVFSMPIAVLVELVSEPAYIYAQLNGFIKLRVMTDGMTQSLRTFGLVLSAYWTQSEAITLYHFGLIQIGTAIIYTSVYFIYFYLNSNRMTFKELFPQFHYFKTSETRKLATIILSFFKQTILKQFLTEGERFVMTFFNLLSFQDQGLYHVISNLGSMAARFVFAPIEESSYLYFSQCIDRNESRPKQLKEIAKKVARILNNMLKIMILLGLIIFVFGYHYSNTLLLLYGGAKLSEPNSISLMRWQCFYVAVIAINGITETFTFAAMSESQLNRFNYAMIGFSVLFLLSAFVFVKLFSLTGFILAVCLPMIGRIFYSSRLISGFFRRSSIQSPLLNILPHWSVISTFTAIFLGLFQVKNVIGLTSLLHHFIFVTIGGVAFLVLCAFIYIKEKPLITFIRQDLMKSKPQ